MTDYWAWGGKYIGFREGNDLYSKKGTPIGYFHGTEVYGFDGKYLCEVEKDRLIVKLYKKSHVLGTLAKPCNMCGKSYANYVGYVMISGCQDFIWDK